MAYRPPPPQVLPPPISQTNPLEVLQPKKGNNQPRTFSPIAMTYTELLPHLIHNSLVVLIPLKPIQPPYPKTYDPNAKCDYHASVISHTTENYWGLKHKLKDLIDMGCLSFKENGPNVGNNLLPGHEST
ncbi:hypothetical protein CR513_23207, partial [Mucuna pruriens]